MGPDNILQLGNETLRQRAKPVSKGMRGLRQLTERMFATMDAASGVGLAAPQIGVSLRVIVVDADEVRMELVNPEIVKHSDETILDEEGCLSLTSYFGPVERYQSVVVKGRSLEWKQVRIRATDLLARVFQHEIDHLNGTLFVDHLEDPEQLRHADLDEELGLDARDD
jgi:peptide deformylase